MLEKAAKSARIAPILKQQRTAISVEDKRQWDQTIARHLRSFGFDLKPETLAVFWPIQSEPDLLACFYELHQSGLRLAFTHRPCQGTAIAICRLATRANHGTRCLRHCDAS